MSARTNRYFPVLIAAAILSTVASPALHAQTHSSSLGVFEDHGDVGAVLHPGTARYDAASDIYTVTGSGENMWFGVDDFHFAWKKVSGDVAISPPTSHSSALAGNHTARLC